MPQDFSLYSMKGPLNIYSTYIFIHTQLHEIIHNFNHHFLHGNKISFESRWMILTKGLKSEESSCGQTNNTKIFLLSFRKLYDDVYTISVIAIQ